MFGCKITVFYLSILVAVLSLGCSSSDMKNNDESADVRVLSQTAEPDEAAAMSVKAPLVAQISAAQTEFKLGESVFIEFKVENVSGEAVKILPWNTPLESRLNADVFNIERDGTRALFIGRKMRRPEPTEADYVVIESGSSLKNSVDLTQAYNLALAGTYTVEYAPTVIAGLPIFSVDVPVEVLKSTVTIELK